jgi:hypothetical protein
MLQIQCVIELEVDFNFFSIIITFLFIYLFFQLKTPPKTPKTTTVYVIVYNLKSLKWFEINNLLLTENSICLFIEFSFDYLFYLIYYKHK